MNKCRAEDTDHDFLYTSDSDVKNRARIGYSREANQTRSVTSKDKTIGPGRTFQQGQIEAECNPACQYHAAKYGGIHERGYN